MVESLVKDLGEVFEEDGVAPVMDEGDEVISGVENVFIEE